MWATGLQDFVHRDSHLQIWKNRQGVIPAKLQKQACCYGNALVPSAPSPVTGYGKTQKSEFVSTSYSSHSSKRNLLF